MPASPQKISDPPVPLEAFWMRASICAHSRSRPRSVSSGITKRPQIHSDHRPRQNTQDLLVRLLGLAATTYPPTDGCSSRWSAHSPGQATDRTTPRLVLPQVRRHGVDRVTDQGDVGCAYGRLAGDLPPCGLK